MGHIPCDDDKGVEGAKGTGVAKEADGAREACNARVAVVAMGVEGTNGCRMDAGLGNAGEAEVVAMARVGEMEGKVAGEGDDNSGVWKWMWLLAQSINRWNWCSQLILRTAVMFGSRGVTRNVIGMVWL